MSTINPHDPFSPQQEDRPSPPQKPKSRAGWVIAILGIAFFVLVGVAVIVGPSLVPWGDRADLQDVVETLMVSEDLPEPAARYRIVQACVFFEQYGPDSNEAEKAVLTLVVENRFSIFEGDDILVAYDLVSEQPGACNAL